MEISTLSLPNDVVQEDQEWSRPPSLTSDIPEFHDRVNGDPEPVLILVTYGSHRPGNRPERFGRGRVIGSPLSCLTSSLTQVVKPQSIRFRGRRGPGTRTSWSTFPGRSEARTSEPHG